MHPAAVERDFRAQSNRLVGWGWFLLVVAFLAWGWAAWQVFVPHGADGTSETCAPPAVADRPDPYSSGTATSDEERHERDCAAARDWATPVTLLVVSVPAFAAGSGLFAAGWAMDRARRLTADLERATG
ncbi:hypothetical protein B9W68_15060 [Streptomyces sp. CS227]|uniref:hypothetical protein n=1 Tax=Streptomyces sp. CS227 TaxID=1982763 RepID=UPI000B4130BA|nr:hypothetical protein [Streptomyces sp. CS227]OWA11150.1 hypothetical protein B9W68_15060 [Streptomyces sp. CS227]